MNEENMNTDKIGIRVAQKEAYLEYGKIAVRAILLMNGGAAVAILAFLGELKAEANGNLLKPVAMRNAMAFFASGVAAGILTAMLAYVSELAWYDSNRRVGTAFAVSAWITGLAGLLCFLFGCLTAVSYDIPLFPLRTLLALLAGAAMGIAGSFLVFKMRK